MPQAKILGHNGNGEYDIELQLDWSILDRKIADLTTIIDTMAPQLVNAEAAYTNLRTEYDLLVDDEEAAIIEWQDIAADPNRKDELDEARQAIIAATEAVRRKQPALQAAYDKWQILIVKNTQATNQRAIYIGNPRTNTVTTAQAVDKADGSVSLEYTGSYPLIPNGTFVDVYQLAREAGPPQWYIPTACDHVLTGIPNLISPITLPTELNGKVIAHDEIHSAAMFWNSAMLPGYQRWHPIIRRGVITAIVDPDITVQLTPSLNSVDLSMQGDLDTFTFPVDYFCGITAFQAGDAVIVKIDSWTDNTPTGTVIGFAEGPARECPNTGGTYPPGTHLFTWPRIFLKLAAGEEDHTDFTSSFYVIVHQDETGDWAGAYDLLEWSDDLSVYLYWKLFTREKKVSLVVRADDYPATPDLPGTGTVEIDETYNAVSRVDHFTASVPRRCATVDMPDPTVLLGPFVDPSDGQTYYTITDYHPIRLINVELIAEYPNISTQWLRSPASPGDITIPQPGRLFQRQYGEFLWPDIAGAHPTGFAPGLFCYTEFFGTNADIQALTTGNNNITFEATYQVDSDTGGPIYTTTYGLNRIIDNGIGQLRDAEFWVFGDPDVVA